MTLKRALEALERDHRVVALEALLHAWRRWRCPEVALCLDALTAELDRGLDPIEADRPAEFHQRWLEVALAQRCYDLGRLLPGLLRPPLGKLLAQRVDLLLALPPDPRLAAGLIQMVATPPATAQSLFPMWTKTFQALAEMGDVRGRAALQARLEAEPGESRFWPMLYGRTRKLLAALPESAPLPSPAEREQLEAIGAQIARLRRGPPPDEAQLRAEPINPWFADDEQRLALVLDSPRDEAARMVYADHLLERGDPRGELIALQLAGRARPLNRTERRREAALLRAHGRRWLGPLDAVIADEGLEYELGFPAAGQVQPETSNQLRVLIDNPLWGTFRRLVTDQVELLTSEVMRSLRSVGGFGPEVMLLLCRHRRPLAFDEIVPLVATPWPEEVSRAELARAQSLPELRRLALELEIAPGHDLEPSELDWLAQGQLGPRLERLELWLAAGGSEIEATVPISVAPLHRWLDRFERHRSLSELILSLRSRPPHQGATETCRLTLRRSDDRLALTVARLPDEELERLEYLTPPEALRRRSATLMGHMLGGLDPSRLSGLELAWLGEAAEGDRSALAALLPGPLTALVDEISVG